MVQEGQEEGQEECDKINQHKSCDLLRVGSNNFMLCLAAFLAIGLRVYSGIQVVYYNDQHFTSQFFTATGMIWYHDGMLTGSSLIYESQNIESITTERAIMAFYTLVYIINNTISLST